LGVLLPHLAGVIVEEVAAAAGLLLLLARARADTAACPACGTMSGRVTAVIPGRWPTPPSASGRWRSC
jgi:hypothetical protein